jgi:histone H3/H4
MSNLEVYIGRIPEFSKISLSNMIDYFAYFLLDHENREFVRPKDVENCYSTLHIPSYSNIAQYLRDNSERSKGKAQKYLKLSSGYKLTRDRIEEIKTSLLDDIPRATVSKVLRDLTGKLRSESEVGFLTEAIKTFEVQAYRASIIMVWLLTMDHLQEYVLDKKKTEFVAALRKMNNQKSINDKDDFSDLKESTFIEACRGAGIISNDVRKILDVKLGIRNSFAHPSTVKLTQSKALDFIEDLINNVVLKY